MDMGMDAAVARHAERQHGIFTRTQARCLGATDRVIQHRLDTGRWRGFSREALAIAGVPRSFERDLMAATLSIPGALASHESAAQLWGMVGLRRDQVVVTVPLGANHRLGFAEVHESTDLPERDRRWVDGIAVASRERTICDAARLLRPERLGRMIDHQINAGVLEIPQLYERFYGFARRGRPGVRKLRAVLDARGPGFVAPESELEHETLELMRRHCLPEPELQVVLSFWQSLVGRVDFFFAAARLIIEVDGRKYHGPETLEHDRLRDNAAGLAGWKVLHFTWKMVTQTPEYVVASIREGLRLADPP
jgi:hypothetical protein